MQNQNNAKYRAVSSSVAALELATRPGKPFGNAAAFAPRLYFWRCDACNSYVLRCQLQLGSRYLFAETVEPDSHWIAIRLSVEEFCGLTEICRVHRCEEPL